MSRPNTQGSPSYASAAEGLAACTDPRAEEMAAAFTAERPKMLRHAARATGIWADAEEIVQNVFLALLTRYRREGEHPRAPVPYMWRALTNAEADHVKRAARHPVVALPDFDDVSDALGIERSAEDILIDSLLAEELLLKVRSLPVSQREVVKLRYVRGLPVTEVADQLAMRPETVRRYASAGLDKLRTLYGFPDDADRGWLQQLEDARDECEAMVRTLMFFYRTLQDRVLDLSFLNDRTECSATKGQLHRVEKQWARVEAALQDAERHRWETVRFVKRLQARLPEGPTPQDVSEVRMVLRRTAQQIAAGRRVESELRAGIAPEEDRPVMRPPANEAPDAHATGSSA